MTYDRFHQRQHSITVQVDLDENAKASKRLTLRQGTDFDATISS